MKYEFFRTKYKKELLIDCFVRKVKANNQEAQHPFVVTFFEIIFVMEGEGTFILDDETLPYKKGSVLLLPPFKWRQWKLRDDLEVVNLMFEEEFISRFFNDSLYLYRFNYFYNTNTASSLQLDVSDLEEFKKKLHEIQNEIKSLQPDSSHLLRALLYYVLIRLNREYQKQTGWETSFYLENKVLRFRKLLESNIHQIHRVAEYAELLKISPSHLNKQIKIHFGKNASEFIKDRLILEIKKQLLFTDASIAEIAFSLGFSEPSNFNRFFVKRTNKSPKQFRLQNDKS